MERWHHDSLWVKRTFSRFQTKRNGKLQGTLRKMVHRKLKSKCSTKIHLFPNPKVTKPTQKLENLIKSFLHKKLPSSLTSKHEIALPGTELLYEKSRIGCWSNSLTISNKNKNSLTFFSLHLQTWQKQKKRRKIPPNLPLPELASGTKSCLIYIMCTTAIFIEFPMLASA